MNIAERLSEYAQSLSYSDLGEDVTLEAKKRIIDSLGCAIGAFGEAPVKIARKVADSNHQGGSSTILGLEAKTSPDHGDLRERAHGEVLRLQRHLPLEGTCPSERQHLRLPRRQRKGGVLWEGPSDRHRPRLRDSVQALRRRRHQAQGLGPRLLRAGLERPRRWEDHGPSEAEAHSLRQHLAERSHRDEAGESRRALRMEGGLVRQRREERGLLSPPCRLRG